MVHLPKLLYLHCIFSLLEFNISVATTQPKLYVCRNLCQDSIVGNRELPLLRLVNLKKAGNIIYNYPYQVPLRFGEFQDVRVYIRNASNQPVSFLKGLTTVTLLLNKLLFEKRNGLDLRIRPSDVENILSEHVRRTIPTWKILRETDRRGNRKYVFQETLHDIGQSTSVLKGV